MKRLIAILAAAAAASAAGVTTVHRSFRGGLPATVAEARQNAAEKGATVGATRIPPHTKVAAFKKIVGKAMNVVDGNMIWVFDAMGRHQVRLARIDAPGLGQPYGEEAAKFLKALVLGKDVEVHWADRDVHGHLLGIVFLPHDKGVVEINLSMVKNGCARYRHMYPGDTSAYAMAERDARKLRRGLWHHMR